MGITLGFQRSEGTRSRPRRGRSQGFGDMSPTSILEGFSATGNPLKYAILRKIALLAILWRLEKISHTMSSIDRLNERRYNEDAASNI